MTSSAMRGFMGVYGLFCNGGGLASAANRDRLSVDKLSRFDFGSACAEKFLDWYYRYEKRP